MAERRRIIEGTWDCTSCDTRKIPGRHKTCPACGSPRETEEARFDFGARDARTGRADAATVTDEGLVAAAHAGADWSCERCGAGNDARDAACKKCGSPRSASPPPPAPDPDPDPELPPPRRGGGGALAALALAAALAVGLFVWLNGTDEVRATVTERSWTRTAVLQSFEPAVDQAWEDELAPRGATVLPRGGEGEQPGVDGVEGCERRQRGTEKIPDGEERVCTTRTERVQCGTDEVCTVRDLGNGFAEEVCRDVPKMCSEQVEDCRMQTRYREEPVYGRWCRYKTRRWVDLRTVEARGSGDEPMAWPTLEAAGDLQRVQRSEATRLVFTYDDDGPQTYILSDRDFARWPLGAEAVLDVSRMGEVKGLRAPGELNRSQ